MMVFGILIRKAQTRIRQPVPTKQHRVTTTEFLENKFTLLTTFSSRFSVRRLFDEDKNLLENLIVKRYDNTIVGHLLGCINS